MLVPTKESLDSVQSAQAQIEALAEMVAGEVDGTLDIDERTGTILAVHATRDRDVVTLDESEQAELGQVYEDYMAQAIEAAQHGGTPIDGPRVRQEALEAALEWRRNRIVQRIEEVDLIDTGHTRDDVASAPVTVTRG